MKQSTAGFPIVVVGALMNIVAIVGCSSYQVIPKRFEKQVNKNVDFNTIKDAPSNYRGELVVLGGEVLNAKRLADKTRIEVLRLPLTEELIPITDRSQSQGRFYAFDAGSEILDPSVLQEGTPVTLVGEVTGMMQGTIGESQYQYPTVRIKDLTKWDKREVRYWPRYYPYYGGYYWHGFRPFGFYW